ncbi:MAG: hypothetical protein WKG01_32875, partial [Kofleriaceae bacterium]
RGRDAPARITPTSDARAVEDRARSLDEREADLERKLRELTARPLGDAGGSDPSLVPGEQLEPAMIGARAAPFGPVAALRPAMTREQVLAAVPGATPSGPTVWVPTDLEQVTAELFFDASDRFERLLYELPVSARHTLSLVWGPPSESNTWYGTADRWRATISDTPKNGKFELEIAAYTPFSELIGGGPDGLAEAKPLIGASLGELHDRYGGRLLDPELSGDPAELLVTGATDLCSHPTGLVLPLDARGRIRSIVISQCFDDSEANRRSALAAMEKQWGAATARRTADDLLVFAWSLPGRAIDAHVTRDQTGAGAWQVRISPRNPVPPAP